MARTEIMIERDRNKRDEEKVIERERERENRFNCQCTSQTVGRKR